MRTAAVVLAAGKSSRMGTNKLLLKVDGKTVLDRLLDALTQSVDTIVIVTGYDPDPIMKIAEAHRIRSCHNPDHESGMTNSFKVGLNVVKGDDAVFLVLGDQLGLDSNY